MLTKVVKSIFFVVIGFLAIFFIKGWEFEKTYPDVGEGYKLDTDPRYDVALLDDENHILLHGHLLDYAFNNDFIIAVQRVRDDVLECSGKIRSTYDECRDAFKKSTFSQYWIIDKRESAEKAVWEVEADRSLDPQYKLPTNIHGPYTKQEYLEERKALQVPDSLMLKI
jgi:hypothetical protein